MCPGDINPMLLSESSYVCIIIFMPVSPSFFLDKVPFLAFLNKERGMVIYTYSRCSLGDSDSNYVLV